MKNYTGIMVCGLASTPHTLKVYIRGELNATFDIDNPKGKEIRKKYLKLTEKLKPLLNKVQ